MRVIRNSFGSLAIIGGIIASSNFIQAAGIIKPVQTAQTDSIVQIAAESQGLAQVDPAEWVGKNTGGNGRSEQVDVHGTDENSFAVSPQ